MIIVKTNDGYNVNGFISSYYTLKELHFNIMMYYCYILWINCHYHSLN